MRRRTQRAYAELLEIYDELEEAERVHRRLGCPVIEISELSIEETAARVIRLVERRRAEAGSEEKTPADPKCVRSGAGRPGGRSSWPRIVIFYVLLTPVWMGLRALAWLADFRARRRPGYRPPVKES